MPSSEHCSFRDLRRPKIPIDKALVLQRGISVSEARRALRDCRVGFQRAGCSEFQEAVLTPEVSLVTQTCRILFREAAFDDDASFGGDVDTSSTSSMIATGWPLPLYALFYKPRFVLTSREPRDSAVAYLPAKQLRFIGDVVKEGADRLGLGSSLSGSQLSLEKLSTLSPVGRLDFESEGLILLTNDGSLSTVVTHPSYGVRKTYRVLIKMRTLPQGVYQSNEGSHSEDAVLLDKGEQALLMREKAALRAKLDSLVTVGISTTGKLAMVEMKAEGCELVDAALVDPSVFQKRDAEGQTITSCSSARRVLVALADIHLSEGKKHEVRRMVGALGFQTLMLVRTQLAGLSQAIAQPQTVAEALWKYGMDTGGVGRSEDSEIASVRADDIGSRKHSSIGSTTEDELRPGDLRLLTDQQVDSIFALAERAAPKRGAVALAEF